MEIWDAYNERLERVGVDLIRGEPIPEGLYHLVSEILVRHTDGDYLLMRRALTKETFPGYYEASAGGSALKGESAIDCAVRELYEETGLKKGSLTFLGIHPSINTIYFLYIFYTNCDKNSIALQEGETDSFKWVSEDEFIKFINSGEMIPAQKQRYHDHFTAMDYI